MTPEQTVRRLNEFTAETPEDIHSLVKVLKESLEYAEHKAALQAIEKSVSKKHELADNAEAYDWAKRMTTRHEDKDVRTVGLSTLSTIAYLSGRDEWKNETRRIAQPLLALSDPKEKVMRDEAQVAIDKVDGNYPYGPKKAPEKVSSKEEPGQDKDWKYLGPYEPESHRPPEKKKRLQDLYEKRYER